MVWSLILDSPSSYSSGDGALRDITRTFDKVDLHNPLLSAPFPANTMRIDPRTKEAIDIAFENIKKFHKHQKMEQISVETMPGILCEKTYRPIEKVGLYIPGGSAGMSLVGRCGLGLSTLVLPSTSLMLAIPAMLAGVKEIIIATPPRSDRNVCPEVVYVAHKCGVKHILRAGGAQAIAALSYGTENIPKVDKIFGPGNQYVTMAKVIVASDVDARVAIDMPAGPSEVLVVADESSNPEFVVWDLLSQAEHGHDSQVIAVFVSVSESYMTTFFEILDDAIANLPRIDIVMESIKHARILYVNDYKTAIKVSNMYAPEHLILNMDSEKARSLVPFVEHAGSVFVGSYTPESLGDYASGTNHCLPTYGYARMYGGVSTDSFMKGMSIQEANAEGLTNVGWVVEELAEVEGLYAHKNAVTVRLNTL